MPGALRVDLLEAFLVVAEELHFTRASQRLFLSQSGLSRRINSLETILDAPLLLRTTRAVELTPAGLALVPHARLLLTGASAAAAATRALA